MKKTFIIAIALMLTMGLAVSSWAIIAGTPHDVNVMRDTGDDLERCAMCHTPHSGQGSYPLWNRTQASQTYGLYTSPSFDMKDMDSTTADYSGTAAQNDHYATTHCMVCHNGVTSSLVNYPGPGSPVNTGYNFDSSLLQSGKSNLGSGATGMKDDHPVMFTYDPTEDADNNGFRDTLPYGSGSRKAIFGAEGTYPMFTKDGISYNQFECATCHSVHDTVDYPNKSMEDGKSNGTQVYFLRGDNTGSGMCQDCHVNR
jgi:hypothetical protein